MKKFLLAFTLVASIVLPTIAQEEAQVSEPPVWDHGDNISNITYQNVQIYRVYDHTDAYVILYQQQGFKVGQTVIPKQWSSNKENARKLLFRNKPAGMDSYMTIVKQNGEFLKVILTLPTNRFDSVWSVAPYGTQVNTDIEVPDIVY